MKALLVMGTLLGGVGLGQAQDFRPEDFLSLEVGNSWTYLHTYHINTNFIPDPNIPPVGTVDFVNFGGSVFFEKEITIAITQTEVIDGETYYSFSDMPYTWPSVPYYFLAGKKVRWEEGGGLIVRTQDTETPLFRFGSRRNDPRIVETVRSRLSR